MEVLCQLSYGGPSGHSSADRQLTTRGSLWWGGEDLNLRRLRRQIYSLLPLATRAPPHTRNPAWRREGMILKAQTLFKKGSNPASAGNAGLSALT